MQTGRKSRKRVFCNTQCEPCFESNICLGLRCPVMSQHLSSSIYPSQQTITRKKPVFWVWRQTWPLSGWISGQTFDVLRKHVFFPWEIKASGVAEKYGQREHQNSNAWICTFQGCVPAAYTFLSGSECLPTLELCLWEFVCIHLWFHHSRRYNPVECHDGSYVFINQDPAPLSSELHIR